MTWKNGLWPCMPRPNVLARQPSRAPMRSISSGSRGTERKTWNGQVCGGDAVLAEHDLIVVVRDVEGRPIRIDLDHRAVLVAARRHKGALERPERVALAAHQLGQNLGDVARLACRDRYVVDHDLALSCRREAFCSTPGRRHKAGLATAAEP